MLGGDLERTNLMEEICWRQKLRALWLKEGAKCLKYIHWMANSHRRNNSINSFYVDGVISLDPLVISNHVVQFS